MESEKISVVQEVKDAPKRMDKMMCRLQIDLNTSQLYKQNNLKPYNILSTFHEKLCGNEEWTLKLEIVYMKDPEIFAKLVQDVNDKATYAVGEENIKGRNESIEMTKRSPYLMTIEHWRYKGENPKMYSYDRPMVEWKPQSDDNKPFEDLEIAVESSGDVDQSLNKVYVRASVTVNVESLSKLDGNLGGYHGLGTMVPIGTKLVFFEIRVFGNNEEGAFEKRIDTFYSKIYQDPTDENLKLEFEKEKDSIKKDIQNFAVDIWSFTGDKPDDYKANPIPRNWISPKSK